jgi:ribosomal protein S18 acetylase RimI-like enzyme
VHRLVYTDGAWASVPGHAERDLDHWLDTVRRCRSMFIARRNGRPVGWVAGRVLDSGRGYVDMLAVASTERHRGLGRALLLHAFADLQLAAGRDMTLDAQAENAAACGLGATRAGSSQVSGLIGDAGSWRDPQRHAVDQSSEVIR